MVKKPKHFLYNTNVSMMKIKATYVPRMPRDAMLTKLRKNDFLRTDSPALKMIGGRKYLHRQGCCWFAGSAGVALQRDCAACGLAPYYTSLMHNSMWHLPGLGMTGHDWPDLREEVSRVEGQHIMQGFLSKELGCRKEP